MNTGILVCGLNGSGKSTLGRALAARLDLHFIDNEDLFFPKTDPDYLYAAPRSHAEAERLLWETVRRHPRFLFAAVKGDYGTKILPLYRCVILLEVPREIRLQRVEDRSYQKFGLRMRPGGDLFQREQAFFTMAAARREDEVQRWLDTLTCPILRVDGTLPTGQLAEQLAEILVQRKLA